VLTLTALAGCWRDSCDNLFSTRDCTIFGLQLDDLGRVSAFLVLGQLLLKRFGGLVGLLPFGQIENAIGLRNALFLVYFAFGCIGGLN
jgi:hypothetical protein